MPTVKEMAEERGIKIYDTALPQAWVDDFQRTTGRNPFGLFVWSYDGAGVFGKPRAICEEGDILYEQYCDSLQAQRVGRF